MMSYQPAETQTELMARRGLCPWQPVLLACHRCAACPVSCWKGCSIYTGATKGEGCCVGCWKMGADVGVCGSPHSPSSLHSCLPATHIPPAAMLPCCSCFCCYPSTPFRRGIAHMDLTLDNILIDKPFANVPMVRVCKWGGVHCVGVGGGAMSGRG